MKTLRVGIIGVGNIGTAHCGCIAGGRIKGMTLAALCDIDGEKREILAVKYHVPVFEDGDELIKSGLVDAVIVATPHRFHPHYCETALLNANYLQMKMREIFTPAFDRLCMHEFVLDLSDYKKETGVSALDVAKGLIDFGIHPPTMYFPLIVHEALMLEPTETEDRETLDRVAEIFAAVKQQGIDDPESLHTAPHKAPIGRPDEVGAARNPIVHAEL